MREGVRSPVPDLLFDDEREARVSELGGLVDAPERVDASTPLHRLTVFLTYRCNLACPYCKTIARSEAALEARPQKRRTFTVAEFAALLTRHAGTPLRHVHFTGGEASLVPGLEEMLRLARRAGVERLSMTTNGTLPAPRLLALVEAGIDELRVSLDAAEPALGTTLTGRPHAWHRAMETLQGLCAARRAGAPFFLIVNTVVGVANREHLAELVTQFLSLGVDDLKLITDVEAKGHLGAFPKASELKRALHAELAKHPAAAFPLLRRKLETVFAPDAIGLEQEVPRDGWRCFIPLTERTVDGAFYYPCSVYLREGGAPLGPSADPPEVQRQASARFVASHDCASDSICRRYCLHCTRAYNDAANARRRR